MSTNESRWLAGRLEKIVSLARGTMPTGVPTITNTNDAVLIDEVYEAAFEERIKPLRREIAAIKRREETYFKHGALDEMVPWFDLSGEERESALAYFGDDDD